MVIEQARPRVVDGTFLLAGTVMLSTGMVFYLLLTSMAVYTVDRFAAGDQLAGWSATTFVLGAVATRLIAAATARRFGRRTVIIVATCASVTLAALTPLAPELWMLLSVRLLHGATFGMLSTLVISGILTRVDPRRRAEASGYLGLATTLSTALGPFLAVILLDSGGFPFLFGAGVAATMVGAVASLFLRLPEEPARPAQAAVPLVDEVAVARVERQGLSGLAVVVFLVGVAYAGIAAYLTMYAVEQGSAWAVGPFFMVYAATAFVGRLTVGRIQDRFGDRVVLVPCIASFALTFALLGFTHEGLAIVLAGVPMGLGFGIFLPAVQAAAAGMVSPARMTQAVAIIFVSLDLGAGIAPLGLGLIAGSLGLEAMYRILALVVCVAGVLYLVASLAHTKAQGAMTRVLAS